MQYDQPDGKAFKRALRQAYRIKHAKDKKRAIHTLCRNLRVMITRGVHG